MLTLRSKEFNLIQHLDVPVRPDRLVVPVQPGGNYPGIEPVKKHSDVQRGIEPVYQSAWSTDPACGRWENVAAESKQISGWFDPARVFCWLLAPGGSSRRMRLSLSAESYVYFSLAV